MHRVKSVGGHAFAFLPSFFGFSAAAAAVAAISRTCLAEYTLSAPFLTPFFSVRVFGSSISVYKRTVVVVSCGLGQKE